MDTRRAKGELGIAGVVLLLTLLLSTTGSGDLPRHKNDLGKLPPQNGKSVPDPDSAEDDEEDMRPEGTGRTGKPRTTPFARGNCPDVPTVSTFVQISSHSRPQLAPNGTLYFVSDLRESPQLYSVDRPMEWPKQMTFFPDGLRYYALSPDGRRILLATDVGGNEQYDLYLFDLDKRSLEPLIVKPQKRIESVAWSADSTWFAFTSNERNQIDFDLYRFDLKERRSTLLQELKGHNTVSDISPNGQAIALTDFRSVIDSDILIFRQSPSEAGKLVRLFAGDTKLSSEQGAVFSRDSKAILFLSDREGGKHQIFRIAAQSSGFSDLKVFTMESNPIEQIEIDRGRNRLVFLANRQGYSTLGGFELDSTGQKKRLLLLPDLKNQVVSSMTLGKTPRGVELFYAHASATEPQIISSWNHPKVRAWTPSSIADIAKGCLTAATLVQYPSFDGRMIPAFLYLPEKIATPTTFLLYAHGGPESQFRPAFNKVFQYFLARGFGILAPNVRGSTGYGREYTMLDDYKKRMDSVKDMVEGGRWLVKQRLANAGEIGIFGGSYGGFLVLRTIQIEPALFGAASESVGITNFVSFLKNTKPYRRALREIEYGPLEDEAFLNSISPLNYLADIKTPLQIFHGANDARVPVSETENIAEELRKRGVSVETRIFSDEGHSTLKLRNYLEQTKLMAYFFEKHLIKEKK